MLACWGWSEVVGLGQHHSFCCTSRAWRCAFVLAQIPLSCCRDLSSPAALSLNPPYLAPRFPRAKRLLLTGQVVQLVCYAAAVLLGVLMYLKPTEVGGCRNRSSRATGWGQRFLAHNEGQPGAWLQARPLFRRTCSGSCTQEPHFPSLGACTAPLCARRWMQSSRRRHVRAGARLTQAQGCARCCRASRWGPHSRAQEGHCLSPWLSMLILTQLHGWYHTASSSCVWLSWPARIMTAALGSHLFLCMAYMRATGGAG